MAFEEKRIKQAYPHRIFTRKDGVEISLGDSLDFYQFWESPTVIISDGPYGIKGFPGDPPTVETLPELYEPHIREWSEKALPSTTLWFWNTELGWATIHPLLEKYGWEFRNCHVWNKGLGHVAGNANTKTLRKFPVVTEVCVQYVRTVKLPAKGVQDGLPIKEWLRYEWERTGLPFSKTNEASGVKNAATRKYFTKDYLWYFPPADAFQKLVDYANQHGDPAEVPYFSIDGIRSLTGEEWELMRAKFNCLFGINNVWNEPPIRNKERVKVGSKAVHLNQKPLSLTRTIIESSSEPGDVVWEPFGGMCTGAIASRQLHRKCYSAEILADFYHSAVHRLEETE